MFFGEFCEIFNKVDGGKDKFMSGAASYWKCLAGIWVGGGLILFGWSCEIFNKVGGEEDQLMAGLEGVVGRRVGGE